MEASRHPNGDIPMLALQRKYLGCTQILYRIPIHVADPPSGLTRWPLRCGASTSRQQPPSDFRPGMERTFVERDPVRRAHGVPRGEMVDATTIPSAARLGVVSHVVGPPATQASCLHPRQWRFSAMRILANRILAACRNRPIYVDLSPLCRAVV